MSSPSVLQVCLFWRNCSVQTVKPILHVKLWSLLINEVLLTKACVNYKLFWKLSLLIMELVDNSSSFFVFCIRIVIHPCPAFRLYLSEQIANMQNSWRITEILFSKLLNICALTAFGQVTVLLFQLPRMHLCTNLSRCGDYLSSVYLCEVRKVVNCLVDMILSNMLVWCGLLFRDQCFEMASEKWRWSVEK